MRARSFALKNKYGQEYDLNDAGKTGLLTSPKGLGYNYSMTYIDIGDAFVRTKEKAKQSVISGTLIFAGNAPYELYEKFNEFIRKSKELTLLYKTPGNPAYYYRDVDLTKIEKTELDGNVLKCPVEFYCRSLFYSDTQNNFTISEVENELRYDISWPAIYNDYNEREITLSNTGDVDAPITLVIEGYCENPTLVVENGNEKLAEIKFPVTLQKNEKLLYSSLDDDMYVFYQKENGEKENIIQLLDINCENFFKIPKGDSCVRFTSDTGAAYTTSLTMHKFYRTV